MSYVCRVSLAMLLVCLSATAFANKKTNDTAVPTPAGLLNLMTIAVQRQNYKGEFTYEHSGSVNSYQILHAVINGKEVEKIYPLNGVKREIVRSGRSIECGTIGGKLLAGLKVTSNEGQEFGLEKNYRFILREKDRVADKLAWVIQLVPRDEHRLGVLVALDEDSYLPLRYLVFNEDKKLVERLQFVSLENDVSFDVAEFMNDGGLSFSIPASQCVKDSYTPSGHSPWKPGWLPRGFLHTGYSYSEDDGHMETYTDGLGSFSVFVKPSEPLTLENGKRIGLGFTQKGASVAILNSVPVDAVPLQISVVGEIPKATAQKIALSIRKFVPQSSHD